MTIGQALIIAKNKLVGISDSPELDAQWLLQKILNKHETSWLLAHGEEILEDDQELKFKQLLKRRSTGEPLAYILGAWEFFGRNFYVDNNVLIPRPSTEKLIELALQAIPDLSAANTNKPFVIADIGTGSGCIAITLCLELNKRQQATKFSIIATDISEAALNVAKKNAAKHNVRNQIEFLTGNFLAPLKDKNVNLIVSNPPYVPSAEITQAKQSPTTNTLGITFEPALALDGGPEGKDFVSRIKKSGIPSVVETIDGKIVLFNIEKKIGSAREGAPRKIK
jgi:release factor glutamine methyltransferase